ncbi:hypothetical protein ACFQZI_10090 [Mucilaginibacter lutimaris]|uniref:LamG domain-containing protein n=1 Tax=Mucilaginibacter lutimaris TaxID=931629 RepID=A0ABW2ZG77_9SPHI
MASRNGLNPKIRGQKGIGFNRALPAPFGFGNGIFLNSGTLSIPRMSDGTFIQKIPFSVEFWVRCNVGPTNGLYWVWFSMRKGTAPIYDHELSINSGLGLRTTESSYRGGVDITFDGSKQHCVWAVDAEGNCSTYFNGVFRSVAPGQLTPYYPTDVHLNFRNDIQAIDEFRYYSSALRKDQVEANFNSGLGNNPCVTESLESWYTFEKFESLDFSSEQDGSNMQVGIRDYSNKNRHAIATDADTNPVSPTYSLKPF